ncbi:hypothetical protein [Halomonas sp. NO4]|uniref:glutathione S-transferase family protein n=1 Tax=Halomonas sp. NO4 TaxID=2484813 RepID=UPI001969E1E5|nr:hypothetical protein [Halomonas sp. NO4]
MPYRVESGAILLHLGERSEMLMPADPRARSEVIEWLFAALNSVEMSSLPWSLFQFTGDTEDMPGRQMLDKLLSSRLHHMESVLAEREWLAGAFSIADIAMADVLRLVGRFDGMAEHSACRDYVSRAIDDWVERMRPEDRDRVVGFCVAQSKSGVDHEADYRALKALRW